VVIRTIRSEWIKIRTVRMNAVLVIIAIAFPLIVVILTAALGSAENASARDLVGLTTGTSVITAMLIGVIGAAGITGEFGFNTIRPTFAATPNRWKVIGAKAIVTMVVALVIETLVVILAYSIGAAILRNRGAVIDLGTAGDGATAAMYGIVLFAAIVSLLGFGLGLLTRSTPAAVAILILWPLLAELIIAGVLTAAGVDNAFKWMPYQAGANLGNPDAGTASDSLGRVAGGLYFFAVTSAIVVLGSLSTSRRDA
jgi:ABC-2 type transport system permease protein